MKQDLEIFFLTNSIPDYQYVLTKSIMFNSVKIITPINVLNFLSCTAFHRKSSQNKILL